jgi:tripartite-type tricarboxylate transporter receptor subunit TctC
MIGGVCAVRAAGVALLAALGVAFGSCASLAQAGYPNRPINILTPTTAGSGMEVQLRLISDVIQRKSGHPFVIEPKPGAMGMLAATNIARAKPDGYSLLITPNSPLVFNQLTHKTMGYDPQAFRSVSMISSQPLVMGVRGDFPAKTMKEFIDYAKANPGKINYGSQGVGGGNHMAVLLLEKFTGTQMVHVPFNGAEPATQALLRGDIDLFMAPLANILPWYKEGKLKMFAVGSQARSPDAPDAPTFRELGYPEDFVLTVWYALVAPPGTPDPIIEWLNTSISEALREPMIASRFRAMGTDPWPSDPAETDRFLARERALWERVAAENNIQKQ